MRKFLVPVLLAALTLHACKSTRPENKTANTAAATLEKKIPEPKPYMASYTRLSDIIHTKLELSFNWDSCFVYGKATLTARPYFHATDELILDAKGFKINSISMGGRELKYDYDQAKLVIHLGREYTRTEQYTLSIDYVAMPNRIKVGGSAAITSDKGLYFINPDGKDKYKPRQLWSQGETEANSCWFPTIEATNERYTQEIYLTVEDTMKTLSNGSLQYSTLNGNGTRTDYWKQDLTHAPYLTMIAVGNFEIIKDKWRNMEVSYYMEPAYAKYARLIFGKTPEMIEFFSKKMGVDYPWDKFSQIVVRDFVSGAMENTTAVTFFDQMNMTDREYLDNNNEDIVSHELFHHWFGDLVTCESWPNLPLNESFATYGQYLWDEYKYGREEADKGAQSDLMAYLAGSRQTQVDMIRFMLKDREEMFDTNSYQKGGRIIHMLRKYLGDDVFFASLKLYLERNKFQPVEIHHLRLAFEEVSGEDLNWFFNQWFLASGHADLTIDYGYNEATHKASVTITQNQDFSKTPLYRLPLDVDIYTNGKVKRERITVTHARETFEFDVDQKPDLLNVDAEKMLVGIKKDNHSKEEWVYMYGHAPLFLDRYEAIEGLDKYKDDAAAQAVFMKALSDPFWSLRSQALGKLRNLSDTQKESVYNSVVAIARKDVKASIRARAVKVLDEQYKQKDNKAIFTAAATDSAWSVVAASFRTIAKTDKESVFKIAKENEKSESSNMTAAIAEFYAENGTASENSFFINYFERTSGYAPLFVLPYYKTYIKRMDDESIKQGALVMKNMALAATMTFVENSTKSILGEMLNSAKSEETKAYIRSLMDELDRKKK